MAASKVLQFCILISFLLFSTHALGVLLTDGLCTAEDDGFFWYFTEIIVRDGRMGERHYNGCVINKTYTAERDTTKVIVYIKNYHDMTTITLRPQCRGLRESVAKSLRKHNKFELLYLGVHSFGFMDGRFVGEFLRQSIQPHPHQRNFQINTIGEGIMNFTYQTSSGNLTVYQEDRGVLGGNLRGALENIHNELCLTHLLSDDVFDFAESSADIDSE